MAGAVADDHVASEFSSGCGGRLPCASESGDHHSGSRSESALAQQLEDAQIVGVVAVHQPVIFLYRDIYGPDCAYGLVQNAFGIYFAEGILLEGGGDVYRFVVGKKALPGDFEIRTFYQIVRPFAVVCAGKEFRACGVLYGMPYQTESVHTRRS